jgi:hypothetical protein
MDAGIAYESVSVRGEEHKRAVAAMKAELQAKAARSPSRT